MRRIEDHVATLVSVTMVFGFVSVRRQQDCSITALFAGVICASWGIQDCASADWSSPFAALSAYLAHLPTGHLRLSA